MKISIITASYNNIETIENLKSSLINQNYKNWEWIIMDNLSNDGTIEYFENLNDQRIFFTSERDKGIYNAWNKSLDKAAGDYIIFLGADDFILDNYVFENLYNANLEINKTYYGPMLNYNFKHSRFFAINDFTENNYEDLPVHAFPPFPATFFPKSKFLDCRFDENYKIHSDLHFYYSNFSSYKEFNRLSFIVSCMGDEGVTSNNNPLARYERFKEKMLIKTCFDNNILESNFGVLSIYKLLWVNLKFKVKFYAGCICNWKY